MNCSYAQIVFNSILDFKATLINCRYNNPPNPITQSKKVKRPRERRGDCFVHKDQTICFKNCLLGDCATNSFSLIVIIQTTHKQGENITYCHKTACVSSLKCVKPIPHIRHACMTLSLALFASFMRSSLQASICTDASCLIRRTKNHSLVWNNFHKTNE